MNYIIEYFVPPKHPGLSRSQMEAWMPTRWKGVAKTGFSFQGRKALKSRFKFLSPFADIIRLIVLVACQSQDRTVRLAS